MGRIASLSQPAQAIGICVGPRLYLSLSDGGQRLLPWGRYVRGAGNSWLNQEKVWLVAGAAACLLDLVPKGRNETDGTMNWVQLQDEY